MNSDKIARGLLAALAIWIPWAAFTRPESLPALYKSQDFVMSWFFLGALGFVGVIILLDAAVNNPYKIRLKFVPPVRSHLYVALMVLTLIAPFSAARLEHLSSSSLFFYLVIFGGAACMAWVDTKAKWRGKCYR